MKMLSISSSWTFTFCYLLAVSGAIDATTIVRPPDLAGKINTPEFNFGTNGNFSVLGQVCLATECKPSSCMNNSVVLSFHPPCTPQVMSEIIFDSGGVAQIWCSLLRTAGAETYQNDVWSDGSSNIPSVVASKVSCQYLKAAMEAGEDIQCYVQPSQNSYAPLRNSWGFILLVSVIGGIWSLLLTSITSIKCWLGFRERNLKRIVFQRHWLPKVMTLHPFLEMLANSCRFVYFVVDPYFSRSVFPVQIGGCLISLSSVCCVVATVFLMLHLKEVMQNFQNDLVRLKKTSSKVVLGITAGVGITLLVGAVIAAITDSHHTFFQSMGVFWIGGQLLVAGFYLHWALITMETANRKKAKKIMTSAFATLIIGFISLIDFVVYFKFEDPTPTYWFIQAVIMTYVWLFRSSVDVSCINPKAWKNHPLSKFLQGASGMLHKVQHKILPE